MRCRSRPCSPSTRPRSRWAFSRLRAWRPGSRSRCSSACGSTAGSGGAGSLSPPTSAARRFSSRFPWRLSSTFCRSASSSSLAFAAGCLTLAFNVAWGSYLNVLVPREQLIDANAKLMGSYATAQIAGPSLAGVLVQAVTAPFAILVDAVSFLVSALALRSIRAPEPERRLERRASLRHDLTPGPPLRPRRPAAAGDRGQRGDAELLRRGDLRGARALRGEGAPPERRIDRPRLRVRRRRSAARHAACAAGLAPLRRGEDDHARDDRLPAALAIVPLASPGQPAWLAVAILAVAEAVGGIAVMLFDVNTAALRQATTLSICTAGPRAR